MTVPTQPEPRRNALLALAVVFLLIGLAVLSLSIFKFIGYTRAILAIASIIPFQLAALLNAAQTVMRGEG